MTAPGDNPVGYPPFTCPTLWTGGAGLGTRGGSIPLVVRPLWDAGDAPGTTIGALTWANATLSTVHSPYYFGYQNLLFEEQEEEKSQL